MVSCTCIQILHHHSLHSFWHTCRVFLIIIVSFVHYYCHGGWNAVCTFHHVHSYKRHFLGCQLYWYILHWYTHVSNCSRYTIHLGHLLVGAVPNTLCAKRHNRAYSSLNCMNMWHQTFYACAVDAYCHISPSPSDSDSGFPACSDP